MNPAAELLLSGAAKRFLGRPLPAAFTAESAQSVHRLLATIRVAGKADAVQVRLGHESREVWISANVFRHEESSLFIVQIRPIDSTPVSYTAHHSTEFLDVVLHSPDALVLTTADARIEAANASFLDMTQLASEEQALGEPLDRWLGRPGADVGVMSAMLRQHGSLRLFATSLQDVHGATMEVEVSGVSVVKADRRSFGFVIRNVDRRMSGGGIRPIRELPRSFEQLTELIGRISLRDLVRETTDLIERLCIEAALELTGDNRASAAEMLGLSRQSLYMKLHRYGLADRDDQESNTDE